MLQTTCQNISQMQINSTKKLHSICPRESGSIWKLQRMKKRKKLAETIKKETNHNHHIFLSLESKSSKWIIITQFTQSIGNISKWCEKLFSWFYNLTLQYSQFCPRDPLCPISVNRGKNRCFIFKTVCFSQFNQFEQCG